MNDLFVFCACNSVAAGWLLDNLPFAFCKRNYFAQCVHRACIFVSKFLCNEKVNALGNHIFVRYNFLINLSQGQITTKHYQLLGSFWGRCIYLFYVFFRTVFTASHFVLFFLFLRCSHFLCFLSDSFPAFLLGYFDYPLLPFFLLFFVSVLPTVPLPSFLPSFHSSLRPFLLSLSLSLFLSLFLSFFLAPFLTVFLSFTLSFLLRVYLRPFFMPSFLS